jgi:hypothetical protein
MEDHAIRQAASPSVFVRSRALPHEKAIMNDLPAHILDKFERRWASRLARDAAAWRAEQPPHARPHEIVDRAGRHVSVSTRHSPRRSREPRVQRFA